MPQVAVTTNDIIVRAYYLMGEVSPNEDLTAVQVSEGLYYLNEWLDFFSSTEILIPFTTEVTFDLVPGQDKYILSPDATSNPDVVSNQIVDISYCNVIRDNLSYPVRIINRSELFKNTRLLNLQTRPGYIILNRQELFSEIQFYPVPEFPYECHLRIKSYLNSLELQHVLDEVPRFYYRFLRYGLARELSSVYSSQNWSADLEKEYQFMYKKITAASDLDMTINPSNLLTRNNGDLILSTFGILNG